MNNAGCSVEAQPSLAFQVGCPDEAQGRVNEQIQILPGTLRPDIVFVEGLAPKPEWVRF